VSVIITSDFWILSANHKALKKLASHNRVRGSEWTLYKFRRVLHHIANTEMVLAMPRVQNWNREPLVWQNL
jgi:hypothetical protein